MILDCYYRFEQLPDSSKTRRDLIDYTNEYPPLHRSNTEGEVWIYITSAWAFVDAHEERQAEKAISSREGSVSSIYHPDPQYPRLGVGDVKGTEDALLFRFDSTDQKKLDIFVAKGKKSFKAQLFQWLRDGELDEEIERLKRGGSQGGRVAA